MKNSKMKKKTQIRAIAVLSVFLTCALIYLAGFLFFSSHFLPNTYINEVNVSGLNKEAADLKLREVDPYLNITERNKDSSDTLVEKLDLRQLSENLSYDSSSLLAAQDKTKWFLSLFNQKRTICDKITGTYDADKISSLIKDLYCLQADNIVMPQDASIAIEGDKAVMKEAVEGSYIKEENVISMIRQGIDRYLKGESAENVDLTSSYETAASDPNLSSAIDAIQKTLDKTIHFNIDSYHELDLSGEELSSLLKIAGNILQISEDDLSDYISSFCREYNISGSEYIEKSSLKTDLEDALLSEDDETIDVNWIYESGDSLIEVNISEQMLYYYEDDTLILTSPVVTGNGDITDATPTGYFTIRKMKQDSTLSGADYVEHVDYWIGFDETGRIYGFHDASWRDEFGGDIWLYDPSRGCVNMPLSKISQLWDYVDIGTEVYIHY